MYLGRWCSKSKLSNKLQRYSAGFVSLCWVIKLWKLQTVQRMSNFNLSIHKLKNIYPKIKEWNKLDKTWIVKFSSVCTETQCTIIFRGPHLKLVSRKLAKADRFASRLVGKNVNSQYNVLSFAFYHGNKFI